MPAKKTTTKAKAKVETKKPKTVKTAKTAKTVKTVKESDFQAKIIKWLRSKGCFVMKNQQNATTQRGIADVFFCKEGFYGFLEVKKSKNAKRQPGQEAFIAKMDEWSYGKLVYPENWADIQSELEEMLK